MIKIAINGFGRIGRNIVRALYERSELRKKIQIVAINDLGNIEVNAHLLKYDSVHGRFAGDVAVRDDQLFIDHQGIQWLSERDPARLPWGQMDVDLVCECTGVFTDRHSAGKHLEAGARRVLISAPGSDVDATVVYGVNHNILSSQHRIVSNASCTTNCLAPMVEPLHRELGLLSGFMTTVHAYTNDQQLTDSYHTDMYRARAATQSMIPTKTGAAKAISEVLPELAGRLNGSAVRVPTINVSLVDLTFNAGRDTSCEEVNQLMKSAADSDANQVLDYCDQPLISIDFNHSPYSCNFDASQTMVNGSLVRVIAWYDNEWGFSNRMLDNALLLASPTGAS
jgi:glyceraldehyde 3-phosphate dehydrogenase